MLPHLVATSSAFNPLLEQTYQTQLPFLDVFLSSSAIRINPCAYWYSILPIIVHLQRHHCRLPLAQISPPPFPTTVLQPRPHPAMGAEFPVWVERLLIGVAITFSALLPLKTGVQNSFKGRLRMEIFLVGIMATCVRSHRFIPLPLRPNIG